MKRTICGKTYTQWKDEVPVINNLTALEETLWINPELRSAVDAIRDCPLNYDDMNNAALRLNRFAPFFTAAFPETSATNGIIESPLKPLGKYTEQLTESLDARFRGKIFLKCDSHLPISGSIKARGGFYEVLYFAETLAIEKEMLSESKDYSQLLDERFRRLYTRYTMIAGSTGNLGLSIGIMGARLGFKTVIHMSHDARQWKKDLLRKKGVNVIEHQGDFTNALEHARADIDDHSWFVDDEHSRTLFLGYSVAALRLKDQLHENGITVNADHPLFVYLPCGVGGGPGGVTFGLKQVFGDDVHCFFAEPTHSPSMLLGLSTRCHNNVCVNDFGIDNLTSADGLAVGRPSGFVGKLIEPFINGCYTINDQHLFDELKMLADLENLWLEPSALAGLCGPRMLMTTSTGQQYLEQFDNKTLDNATHIAWATGGGMVPKEELDVYYSKGCIN